VKRTKPATPDDLLDLCVAVIELYFRIEAATQAIAGFAQAGGEWGVLRSLMLEGAQTVPAMARARPVSRQHCQTICNRLEAQGLVRFVSNPAHKRSMLVEITAKGRAHFTAMTERFRAACTPYAKQFEAMEITGATELLRRAREMLGA
jgi:DNA-binding MarR family transcriptional regulator